MKVKETSDLLNRVLRSLQRKEYMKDFGDKKFVIDAAHREVAISGINKKLKKIADKLAIDEMIPVERKIRSQHYKKLGVKV